MNPSESQGSLLERQPTPNAPNLLAHLEARYQSLRSLLVATLVGLILLSFGVSPFLFRQMTMLRSRLAASRAESRVVVADFQNMSEPLIRNFVGSLAVFATSNRDFQPILERYRPALNPYLVVLPHPPPGAPPSSALIPKTVPK